MKMPTDASCKEGGVGKELFKLMTQRVMETWLQLILHLGTGEPGGAQHAGSCRRFISLQQGRCLEKSLSTAKAL